MSLFHRLPLAVFVVGAAVLSGSVFIPGSPASAATVVNWTGANKFNDSNITFTGFTANELTAIGGSAMYEGCCSNNITTSFSLLIRLNGNWTDIFDWQYKPDETPKLLSSLLPPAITFATGLVSGIMLTSNPNGSPSGDYNYTNFNFVTYLSRDDYYIQHKSEYDHRGMSYDDYLHCGDYENYVRNMATFTFDTQTGPPGAPGTAAAPIPGTFALFAGGMGMMGLLGWRRRKPKTGVSVSRG